jgi:hypothetical protein
MLPLQTPQSPRSSEWAATQPHGGPRSFPPTRDSAAIHYTTPSSSYQRLFLDSAAAPDSCPAASYSAGWIIGNLPDCNPVFVAHSLLSAIWLLRQTLPNDTLSDAHWQSLEFGAHLISDNNRESLPSSAQIPSSPLPSSLKRTALATQTPVSKRARIEESPTASSPASLQSDANPSPASTPMSNLTPETIDQPAQNITITNNNRRAERERAKKLEKLALQRRQSLGLILPANGAPRAELNAYDSISRADEHTVSWIFKQPHKEADFYCTTKSPYLVATAMLEKARALGNPSSQHHAAVFLQSWRTYGSPFPTNGSHTPVSTMALTSSLQDIATANHCTSDVRFRSAWLAVDRCERQHAAIDIQYRWAMAYLGRAYEEKIAQLQQEDCRLGLGQKKGRAGKGYLKKQAQDALMPLIADTITARNKKKGLQLRLTAASRWYSAATRLGWGILCIMPYESIPKTWVEQAISKGQWQIWMDLVEKVNPDAYAASSALELWLGSESIAGGPINEKQALRIELEGPIHRIEEVLDSDGDSDDEDLEGTQSQPMSSAASLLTSRQKPTLLELFK